MNWLITGGAGYIGSHIVKALLAANHRITVFDDLSTGKRERVPEDARFFQGSLLNCSDLERVLHNNHFDGIIHLAGKKSVQESFEHPHLYFETNVIGTQNLVDAAVSSGVNRIIFSSTAAVYAEVLSSQEKINENSLVSPNSPYGDSKLAAEEILQRANLESNLKAIIFRYFNIVGSISPLHSENAARNLVPVIEDAIRTKNTVSVFGTNFSTHDGTCIRDYLHIIDLCEAHTLAVEKFDEVTENRNLITNLGTGRGYSVLEVISELEKTKKCRIPWKSSAPRPGDSAFVVCDASRAKEVLRWEAKLNPFKVYDF